MATDTSALVRLKTIWKSNKISIHTKNTPIQITSPLDYAVRMQNMDIDRRPRKKNNCF